MGRLTLAQLGQITGINHRQHSRRELLQIAHTGDWDGTGLCTDPIYCPVCQVPMGEDDPIRALAVEIVDAIHGHTAESCVVAGTHITDYAIVEQKLRKYDPGQSSR